MSVGANNQFDKRLVEIYYDKKTVAENTESKIDQNRIWDCMEMISLNNKAVMNFKVNGLKIRKAA